MSAIPSRDRGDATAARSRAGLAAARVLGPASSFWAERNPRERTLMTAAAAIVLFALIWLALFEPALQGREQLRKLLPGLTQQVAQMQVLAREATHASAAPGSAPTADSAPPITRESIEASLTRSQLTAQSVNVSGEIVRLQLNNAAFSRLVAWLEQERGVAGISVVEASIVAQTQPDTVNATLTLRQQRRP